MRDHLALLLSGSALAVGIGLATPAAAQQTTTPTTDLPTPPEQATPVQNVNDQTVTPTGQAGSPAADAGETDTVVVTGSRIPRAGFDTIQPAVVLGADQIEDRGYTNLGTALSELPAFGVPGNSPVGAQSGFGAAQTFVDFFSLGSQRTLTLVNGRRFVSANSSSIFGPVSPGSQVDFNTIPVGLVDRVETVAIGGAPIYGSDAIAGTINVILKRNFKGVQVDAQAGISQRGDAPEYRLGAIVGQNFAGDRGNIVVAGEWNKSRGLATSDRFLTSADGPFFTTPTDEDSPFGQVLYYNQRYNVFTNTGTPLASDFIPEFGGIFDPAGNVLTFNNQGQLVPLDFGERTGSLIESVGGNGFALGDYGNLLANSERYLATTLATFDVTDNIRLFGEGWYANSTGTNLRDQPVYNTYLFGEAGDPDGNIILNVNNPYLSAADRATIASNLDFDGDGTPDTDEFFLTRANTDLASGRATSKVQLFRFVGGLDGNFQVGERRFNWEASLNYGRATTKSTSRELVQQNFENAIDAVAGPGGTIICRPGSTNAAIPTLNSTCAPLNLFGLNNFSQEALDYVTTIAKPKQLNKQLVFNANIAGALFTLPAGDLGFSLGYEHRRESTRFDPGAFFFGQDNGDGTRTQFGRSIPIDPVSGSFHTNEVFGELRIPVISPAMNTFIHELEFEGAARYVKNSIAGGDLTWTAGGRFAPVRDITFRGNFTRSIRAPAITEIFNPTSQAFESGNDPCDARFITAGPNPSVRAANCATDGIVQPFTSNYSDFTVPIVVSGNPDLENEKANSWTVGAVLRPRFVPGFTLAVDYVSIKLKNAITSLSGNNILNACYDNASFPNQFCGLVDRDNAGQITLIREGFFNAAALEFSGVTSELAYRFNLSDLGLGANAGRLGLSLNYLYVDKQFSRVAAGDIDTSRGEIGNPKHSLTANLKYENRAFDLLWQTQYFGKGRIDADADAADYEYPGVGDWWLFNASAGLKVGDRMNLRFIVDNILDKKPPFPAPAGGGTITYYSGLLGRYFRVSTSLKF